MSSAVLSSTAKSYCLSNVIMPGHCSSSLKNNIFGINARYTKVSPRRSSLRLNPSHICEGSTRQSPFDFASLSSRHSNNPPFKNGVCAKQFNILPRPSSVNNSS